MKLRIPVLICFTLALAVLAVFMVAARREKGMIRLTILDGRTDEPLNNAVVVIPETGKIYRPDRLGQTGEIRVPITKDERYDSILKQDWGEVTVLVYCEGYYPLALFHLMVRTEEPRTGPTLYLYPDDGSLAEPFALSEGPDSYWVSELIEKYRSLLS